MTTARKHVLVAEDSPVLAKVIQFHLKRAGFDVCLASNGKEACDYLVDNDFDLVVTDQQMPIMSGSEFTAHLRRQESYKQTPLIFLTGKSLELDGAQLKADYGISALLSKPFSPSALVELIQATLAEATC